MFCSSPSVTKGIVDENFAISKQHLFHWLTHKHCLLSCEIRNAYISLVNDVCKSLAKPSHGIAYQNSM